MDLIDRLIEDGWLKSERIIKAFRQIKREDFVPEKSQELADLNKPLSIGHGQTISQPLVVAFMLELLNVQEGDKVLDIGCGSGWTTALLAELVGERGQVISMEIVDELVALCETNIMKYNSSNKEVVRVIHGDGKDGYSDEAPFDRVLVSAEAKKVPDALKRQLKVGGLLVIPIGSSICVFEKVSSKKFNKREIEGFRFVPLV